MPVSKSVKETGTIAARYLRGLSPQRTGATVIGLSGDLGSGKTAFVKAVAKTLGVRATVTSPTFVIEKIYKLPKRKKFSRLVHIDAYRLSGKREFETIFPKNMANDPGALVFIEWPENIEKGLPKRARKIAFRFIDETTRTITWRNKRKKN